MAVSRKIFENAICIMLSKKPQKDYQKVPRSKIIQNTPFLPTLLSNFWCFAMYTLVFNRKWWKFGPAPP